MLPPDKQYITFQTDPDRKDGLRAVRSLRGKLYIFKEDLLSFLGLTLSYSVYIGLCACKWSAKANIPVFPSEGVSLPHTPPPA